SGAERGGIRRYANAGRFHGFDLRLGAALPAGDDSPGMAHAPAGRGGESGYKSDGRLLCLGALQKLGGIFFCTAADLADHDQSFSLRIGEKQLKHIDELRTLHWIAADADARRLAKADT